MRTARPSWWLHCSSISCDTICNNTMSVIRICLEYMLMFDRRDWCEEYRCSLAISPFLDCTRYDFRRCHRMAPPRTGPYMNEWSSLAALISSWDSSLWVIVRLQHEWFVAVQAADRDVCDLSVWCCWYDRCSRMLIASRAVRCFRQECFVSRDNTSLKMQE